MHPIIGQNIFVLVAHPDDEGYLFAGTIWKNHRAQGQTTLVCATLGEKGSSHLPRPLTVAQVKRRRLQELEVAAKFVGINTLVVLGLPDGRVCDAEDALYTKTRRLLLQTKPSLLFSFGPDGFTGHRDHIACWRLAKHLSKELKIPLFMATVPPRHHAKAAAWMMARRVNPHYHRIRPYQRATHTVRLPRGLKLAILKHYPSQITPGKPYPHLPPAAAKDFARSEYFSRSR